MTRAHSVVHTLLEDGPEEVSPNAFIDQYAHELKPEVFMQSVVCSGYGLFEGMERLELIQLLRKKYDDDAIAEAVMLMALERSPNPKTRRAYLELKRLASFRI